MSKITITHEFEQFVDDEQIKILMNAMDANIVLGEILEEIRSKLKYGTEDWIGGKGGDFLEHLRDMIHESGFKG